MSAPRDDSVYLGHIRDAITRIETYVASMSEQQFLSTPLVQDAVIHQIQIQWQGVRIEERRNDFVFYFLEREPVRVRKAAIGAGQGVQRLRSFLMAQAGARAKLLS